LGKNRLPYFADQLTLNESVDGIAGFNNTILYGTRKMLVRFQIQSYSPWNFAGFRLNPFLGYNMGILGNETTKFKNNKAYSKISVGVLINNDYLIFGNFQLSFSYYPSIPGVGDNVFGTNSFNTEDFNFRDFEIGKPQIVNYR
jgi:hemolysin activation/secretion protein